MDNEGFRKTEKMTNLKNPALYYKYWGKAKKSIEVDYSLSIGTDVEIAKRYGISLKKLEQRVEQYRWEKVVNGQRYLTFHLLPYHSLDVAAVGYLLLDPEKRLCRELAAA